MKTNQDTKHMYDMCKSHMHSYVLAQTSDGSQFDGIITGLDDEYVYFAVPLDNNEHMHHQDDSRFFGYPGYGFGYGFPPRRFRRIILPLAALTALTLLPWY